MGEHHPIENLRLLAVHLEAPNDAGGNPQRAFLVLDKGTGQMVDVVDEEYSGPQAVTRKYPGVTMGVVINVGVREYKAWLRVAKEKAAENSEAGSSTSG